LLNQSLGGTHPHKPSMVPLVQGGRFLGDGSISSQLQGLRGEGNLCRLEPVKKPRTASRVLNRVRTIPAASPLTSRPLWEGRNRSLARSSRDEARRHRILQCLILCVFLLPLFLRSSWNLHAQKQPSTAKVQRPGRPVAPTPAPKPKIKAPEYRPAATTAQAPLASLQPPVTEARLPNGLKVLLQENHGAPLVSVGCWYRVGSKDDPAGAAGLSNLARMLRLREIDSYSRGETGRLMRETGGDWHSMTLPDQTGFFETVPVGALEEVLKLEAARMSAGVAGDLQFRGQRRRAAAEIRAREDRATSLLDDEVAAAAFQRHPYRWPSAGWLPDVELISRETVAQHSRKHFVPNNAVLVLVGDFETRTALGLVEKHFGLIARRPDPWQGEVREPERRGERRVRAASEGAAPGLQFAFPAPELFNDDFHVMLVIDAVLTGAQGMRHWPDSPPAVAKRHSRLFQALVESGLALEVRSRIAARQAPGLYQLALTLPDAFQFQAAEEAVLEQLERLKSHEVTDAELAKAKNRLVAGEFLAQDSVSKRAFQLGYFESIASHQVLNEIDPKISRVSKDDLRRVAMRYFAESGRTVGSVAPALKRREIEVETLAAAGSNSQAPAVSDRQPPPSPRELNAAMPSLQAVFKPESVFDVKTPDGESRPGRPASQARTLAEIATASLAAPKVHRKVLANGVTLIAARHRSGSTVTIRAAIRPGPDGGPDMAAGMGALMNVMLTRGTSVKKQAPLAAVFEFLGAEVSSEIDASDSTTTVRGLSKDCAAFLELLAEMFQFPSFEPAEFDRARVEVLGQLRKLEGEAGWVAGQELRRRFYTAGHTLPQGLVRSVESLGLAGLRDFYHRYYQPQRLIVSIAGDVPPEEALAAGESAFGGWKGDAANSPSSAGRTMPSQQPAEPLALSTKQSALLLAGIASLSPVQPDYYPFLILNQVLAGPPDGGRLGDRVLASDAAIYGIQGEVTGGMQEQLFSLRVAADRSEVDNAIALLREEFGRMRDQSITDEEIKRAKRALIHAWAIRLASNDGLAETLQHIEAQALGLDYLERVPSLIEGVSQESLLDCARTRFDFNSAAIVVMRPGGSN
jgi:zinc protease